MLDTFIIERIRQERERKRESGIQPLRIERRPPRGPEEATRERERPRPGRGSSDIDFKL